MKSSKIVTSSLIALSALVASSAFAGGLTRDQVQADFLAARAAGALPVYVDGQVTPLPAGDSTLTRAQVEAEYVRAAKAGALPSQVVDGAPDRTSVLLTPSTASRDAVRADFLKAQHDGTLPQFID